MPGISLKRLFPREPQIDAEEQNGNIRRLRRFRFEVGEGLSAGDWQAQAKRG